MRLATDMETPANHTTDATPARRKRKARRNYAKECEVHETGKRYAIPILKGALAEGMPVDVIKDRLAQALAILEGK